MRGVLSSNAWQTDVYTNLRFYMRVELSGLAEVINLQSNFVVCLATATVGVQFCWFFDC
jgi:hypothetical protein